MLAIVSPKLSLSLDGVVSLASQALVDEPLIRLYMAIRFPFWHESLEVSLGRWVALEKILERADSELIRT
ncbi:hypothetical protein ACFSOZ_19205 [Mesorhizobium newzealandense]|uniref:Uncharacterized protein n=1 Tax=Mesorhizobium newzealandense TaxID=1300302 RepID=A0ABW4UBL7_9HYPH|nr:hypothetical protein [Mesorhizobium sophorae]